MQKCSAKAKIIESARQIFIEKGFAGTSTQSIAKMAKVSHSLIFHHFSNKEALWQAVKQSIACDESSLSKTLPSTSLPFVDFLKELVVRSIHFYRSHPDIVRLISWQRLETQVLDPSRPFSPEALAWIQAIKHYQDSRDINLSLKPEFVMGFILSITSSAALDQQVWIRSPPDQEAYVTFCVECFIKAFK